jgi:hypothetical protein
MTKLETKLLDQCFTNAKGSYAYQLQDPDSPPRILIHSMATVMERELKNLERRMIKRIDSHVDSRNILLK